MYCKKCGNKLKEDAKFCPRCGEKVPTNVEIDYESAKKWEMKFEEYCNEEE